MNKIDKIWMLMNKSLFRLVIFMASIDLDGQIELYNFYSNIFI